jgi:predicted permease
MNLSPRGWIEATARDVRLAARGLRRTPAFTAVSILSIAIGVILATVTTSVVNAYLIKALPYPDARHLYNVMYAPPGPWEPDDLADLDWRSVSDVVEAPISSRSDGFVSRQQGVTTTLSALRVGPSFLSGLGVHVTAGRTLGPGDFAREAPPVAIVSQRVWREALGAATDLESRAVELQGEFDSHSRDRVSLRVVGVLPNGFYYGRDRTATIDVVVPESAPMRTYMVRLRDGVSPAAAERRLSEAVRATTTSALPASWPGVRLESAIDRYVGTLRPALVGVTAAIVLMLSIVCANVAVLMLLRSMRRQRELAVRVALGSTSMDLARMLIVESTMLVGAGAAIGLAASLALLRTLAPSIEEQLGRPSPRIDGFGVDSTVIGVTAAICLAIVMVIALMPLAAWSRRLVTSLRQNVRISTDGRVSQRLRQTLIAFEVAGSLVLLIGCGLLLRSVNAMVTMNLGFDDGDLVHARVMLKAGKYADGDAASQVHAGVAARIAAATGSPVAFSTWPPFVVAPDRRIDTDTASTTAGMISVTPGYFSLFHIPVRAGQDFTNADLAPGASVAIVSETLASRLWPPGTAVGRRVRLVDETPRGLAPDVWRTVIGVAGDVRQGYGDPQTADFYRPKMPDSQYGTFYLRSARPMGPLIADIRAAAATVDPDVVIGQSRAVVDDDRALGSARRLSTLLLGFAAMSMFLAMLGIYGVTAYAVAQRHKEIAIRSALGASAGTIVWQFMRQGAFLLAIGSAIGVGGGVVLSRGLSSQVFGVERLDALTSVVASGVLIGVGLLSVWGPARRAARVEPVRALAES